MINKNYGTLRVKKGNHYTLACNFAIFKNFSPADSLVNLQ